VNNLQINLPYTFFSGDFKWSDQRSFITVRFEG